MGRHPQSSQDRRRNNSKKMKFAISILFLAATSRAAPSISDMNTGSVHNTLDRTQKATDIQITNKVIPDIQRNFDLIKQTNEREYNETSQIYEYIDASIAHATKSIMKAITDLKTNTDESIRALGENTRENFISLKTINNENNQKIPEKTVDSSDSALALSLNWMSRRMDAAEDILTSRVGVCGVSDGHTLPGVVTYDRILHPTEGDKKIRLAGKNLEVNDVFDKTRGFFTVPKNGSGKYSISVGMVMKVFDWQPDIHNHQNVLSQYKLHVGDRVLDEALLASDNGASENADIVQASRSIVVHLLEGQVVKLVKSWDRPISSDFYITFCVSMKHLDSALSLSKKPETRPSAPSVDLKSWTFDSPSLNTIAPPTIETIAPPSRLPRLEIGTTETPLKTPPPCRASGFDNCN